MGRLVALGRRVVPESLKRRLRESVATPPTVMSDFLTHARCVEIEHGTPQPVVVFQVSQDILRVLSEGFEASPRVPITDDSRGVEWYAGHLPPDVYASLNADHVYLDCEAMRGPVTGLMESEASTIARAVGSPYRVVNVRAWETRPSASRFGPTETHSDNFEPGHLKLLVYLDGLGPGRGSIELDGYPTPSGPEGIAVVFQNSDILHRAIPATDGSRRPVIEVTLQRLLVEPSTDALLIGTLNDRHLSDPFIAYSWS